MKKNTAVAVESRAGSLAVSPSPRLPVSASPQGWAIPFSPGEFRGSLHQQHRSMEQGRVLAFVKRRIQRQWGLTKVVGSWVWVIATDTLTELERSMLFELGFHWNGRRRVWQHPCGVFAPRSSRVFLSFFPAEAEV